MRAWCPASVAAPPTTSLPRACRARIITLLVDKYADFGQTLAVEKLLELEGIMVSAETIRQFHAFSWRHIMRDWNILPRDIEAGRESL
jgi:hypothetical protein